MPPVFFLDCNFGCPGGCPRAPRPHLGSPSFSLLASLSQAPYLSIAPSCQVLFRHLATAFLPRLESHILRMVPPLYPKPPSPPRFALPQGPYALIASIHQVLAGSLQLVFFLDWNFGCPMHPKLSLPHPWVHPASARQPLSASLRFDCLHPSQPLSGSLPFNCIHPSGSFRLLATGFLFPDLTHAKEGVPCSPKVCLRSKGCCCWKRAPPIPL